MDASCGRIGVIGGIAGVVVYVCIRHNSREHINIAEPVDLPRCLSIEALYVRLPCMRGRGAQAMDGDDAGDFLVENWWDSGFDLLNNGLG